ncbi:MULTISPECIES: hypothetical protein [unclassified Nonomuraea]|uniref:hypothetical protein n=1 Tax=unclassified Nonomuraea TaxID=2593643 RepID=UPI0035C1475D
MRKILVALAAAVALAAGAVPAAAAGGWAVTYLDPPPSRFEAGQSYALGFWVLQHGTHPFVGKLDPVGLRLTRADGESVTFEGTALPEAAHYATSVVVPEGVWKVEGLQGWFRPYEVGTLTVPGSLRINPVPPDLVAGPVEGAKNHWGDVRPPGFEPGTAAAAPAQASAPPVSAPASAAAAASTPAEAQASSARVEEAGGVPAYTLLLAAIGGAVLAVAALRLLTRRRDDEPDPPVDEKEDTIVISG